MDRFGRTWNLPKSELCSECGQPDNCGDCNHDPLTDEEAQALKGYVPASEYFYMPATGVFGRAWTEHECNAAGDDWSAMYYKTNGGYVFGDWASAGYIKGEAGSNHITRLIPIPEAVYLAAKEENWDMGLLIVGVI